MNKYASRAYAPLRSHTIASRASQHTSLRIKYVAVCVTSALCISLLAGCSSDQVKTNTVSTNVSDNNNTSQPADNYGPKPLTSDKMTVDTNLKSFTKTKSGLLYKDLIKGTGSVAEDNHPVIVNYTGYLKDGTVFDSSYKSGNPFTFVLGRKQVIAGWDEGVKGMKEGGKRRLIIPPLLGYGSAGQDPIPPDSTLYFDVELLKANAASPAAM